jgi:hypothetical protein
MVLSVQVAKGKPLAKVGLLGFGACHLQAIRSFAFA